MCNLTNMVFFGDCTKSKAKKLFVVVLGTKNRRPSGFSGKTLSHRIFKHKGEIKDTKDTKAGLGKVVF